MDVTAVISLVISIISLAAAVYIGVKQYLTQRKANNVPVFELLKQIEEPTFLENFGFITGELKDYDPDQGLIGMPAEARKKVLAVCYFFSTLQCSCISTSLTSGRLQPFSVHALLLYGRQSSRSPERREYSTPPLGQSS